MNNEFEQNENDIFMGTNTASMKGKKYTLEEIKSVNNYISDNGIKVKGVVILARTKDLLKYKDNKLISDINVIHAELDFTPDY